MAGKLMYIPNDDTQNYSMVETLGHSVNELTNQNLIKVPKVVKIMDKKTLL